MELGGKEPNCAQSLAVLRAREKNCPIAAGKKGHVDTVWTDLKSWADKSGKSPPQATLAVAFRVET